MMTRRASSGQRRSRAGRFVVPALLAVLTAVLTTFTVPAYAAGEANIDHVQEVDGSLQILLALPQGVTPDLASVQVTLGDATIDATAVLASDASSIVRTTILAIDLSNSMEGARFDAAKQAAQLFLQHAPQGLRVGVIGFGTRVERLVEPTTDLAAVSATIDSLELLGSTKLFDGIEEAVKMAGDDGARSILLLSDGADNSDSQIEVALAALGASGEASNRVKLDAISLQGDATANEQLSALVGASTGTLLEAATPEVITGLFQSEAEALRSQLLVTAPLAEDQRGKSGNLAVSINADGQSYADSAFISVKKAVDPNAGLDLVDSASSALSVPKSVMWIGLGAAALGLLTILAFAFGIGAPSKKDSIDHSIEAYTRQGAQKLANARNAAPQQSVTQQAVGAAAKVLENSKGLETTLGQRLEAAGLAFKPAEWLLIHAGLAIGAGFVGLALGGGNILFLLLMLVLGVVGPWAFLSVKRTRRLAAFKAQLADTLQLMSGSLSAGLSLAQGVDTVVREGSEPMASELRRALVEVRLGVSIEDALAGVAERMQSKDFEWIVMAIRIQREVGGNLAELLNNVGETIREREYLERQVLTLSAEGRISVWILGGLPPVFIAYLALTNPNYLSPLFTTSLGIAMLVMMGVMEAVGVLWMRKVVKVQV